MMLCVGLDRVMEWGFWVAGFDVQMVFRGGSHRD